MNPPIWPPVFAGVGWLVFALVSWVWGQRRRSLALRWGSLGFVAWALVAGLRGRFVSVHSAARA